MLLFAVVFLGCALIVIAAARPLILRRVPPNRIYGVRFRATYADEWVWYEANAAGRRDLLRLGIVQVAAALMPLAFLRPTSWASVRMDRACVVYLTINACVCLLGLLLTCTVSFVRANRLLKQRIATGVALKPKPPGH